ncbi:MAG: TonB-dependent receptor [Prevotella sp.]|nr:TonB-dependent receptor [Prevotella sp.]
MVKRLFIATFVAISPLLAVAQGLITGHITDVRTGEPLIGASVIVKSEKGQGVVTDIDGNFSLQTKVEAPLTLRVEYVGYRALDVDVYDFEEPVEISLIDNASRLNEVVVVGYGAQKRLELTSSISSVGEDLLKQQNTSVEGALQGAVAGLNVTTTSGQPGAASIIRVRGGNSITGGNEPLYVIDGFIVYNDPAATRTGARTSDATLDPLSFLNPSDIESIEVLKDVSATAIYGTRGANGVIIITTKKGSHGKNNISYNASFGWSQISKKLDYLDAWQWADIWNELYQNGEIGYGLDTPTATYDWQDAALRTGFQQEHQLSAVGGDEISRYSISGSYKSQEGIVKGTDLTRYSGRINYERNVFKTLLVGLNANAAYNKVNGVANNSGSMFAPSPWYAAISHTPYTSIYNADGTFNYDPTPTSVDIYNGKVGNPISDLENTKAETENTRIIGTAFAEWTIIPQLKLRASIGADLSNTRQSYYAPSYTTSGLANNGYASVGQTKTNTWQTEYTATYSNVFKRVHSLTVLAGYTAQSTDRSSIATTAYGFSNDATGYDNLGAAATTQPSKSSHYVSTLQSWIGRVNYSYDSRYNASLTLRADGSSRFAKDHRWGWFPSLGASWNIDREKWVHLGKKVDFIQLRASIGTVGNQEIGDYQFAANVEPRTVVIDGMKATSYIIANKSNPDLKWETTTSYNIGLSSGFFQNRLTVTFDAYYKKTNDLLLDVPVEQVTGFSTVLRNVGSVTNKGVELEVGGVLIDRKDLKWNVNANIAHNKNEVTSLGDSEYFIPSFSSVGTLQYIDPLIVKVGEPLGTFYGYRFKGIIQSDEEWCCLPSQTISVVEPGNPKFEDVNGDNVVNEQDRVVLGNIQPDFTYGFNTKVTYKNLDFFLSLSGSYGNKLFNALACRLDRGNGYYYNPLAEVADRWTPTNPSNTIQKASSATSIYADDRFVEDASYLKFRNIQLGYTIPLKQITRDAKVRLYVALQNFFTITSYSGYDPEANRNGIDETSALYQGVDYGAYPTAKTVLVGFNVTL